MHIDYFSGAVIDLKRGQRTAENVLAVLAKHPRVSTWDMGEFPWLRKAIKNLEQRGLIEARDESYPWHRYAVTDRGMDRGIDPTDNVQIEGQPASGLSRSNAGLDTGKGEV